MASKSQRPMGRDRILPRLDTTIKLLGAAKDVCGVAPAQIALGSACVLLTVIRVCPFLFFDNELPVHVCSGYYRQQTGFC